MSRNSIDFEPGHFYHIYTHANGVENLFREETNYEFFLNKYKQFVAPAADTFAYCLMPNHLHFMVRIKSETEVLEFVKKKKKVATTNSIVNERNLQGFENLGGLRVEKNFSHIISQQFSNLFNSYSKAYNKRYSRKGSLFIPNFKRKVVKSDTYYLALITYIHFNPVHHGFVKQPGDWPHSSWHAYWSDKPTQIRKNEALEWAGGRDAFFRLHREIRMVNLKSLFEEE